MGLSALLTIANVNVDILCVLHYKLESQTRFFTLHEYSNYDTFSICRTTLSQLVSSSDDEFFFFGSTFEKDGEVSRDRSATTESIKCDYVCVYTERDDTHTRSLAYYMYM